MRLAVEQIRRMRGGAQAHLMRCDDDSFYVVKFKNNPQHLRVLANEMFATRLAARMGICVPDVDIVEVPDALIKNTNDLSMQYRNGRIPCAPGMQFGSRYPGHPSRIKIHDFVSPEDIPTIVNIHDFLGVFVFDKWTCNTDGRQVVLVRESTPSINGASQNVFKAMMIDQGFCFGGGEWHFQDAPRRGLYEKCEVYKSVQGIEAFEPWLNWLENRLVLDILYEEAERVPIEWYEGDHQALASLIEKLFARRTRVRDLIWSTRHENPNRFANWIHAPCQYILSVDCLRVNRNIKDDCPVT